MFNEKSISENIYRTFLSYGITYIINIFFQFYYRTAFLRILSKEYLGLESLFSNVIQMLSLAELGIGTIIAYHLYEPIKGKDTEKIADIMKVYKVLYYIIAIVISLVGILAINSVSYLVKDLSEIPGDIDLKFIYLLFLAQCVTSYFFSYKQTILSADQRGDKLAILLCLKNIFLYLGQIAALKIIPSYVIMRISAIAIGIFCNLFISIIISRTYKYVFSIKRKTNYLLIKEILSDAKAMLCHRVGGTILNSTDNIIMSTFIGLGVLGKYSNYSFIINAIQNAIGQVIGNFNGSIGKAGVTLACNDKYSIYKKLEFINLCIANVVTVCLFILISPFMSVWQGNDMILNKQTVAVVMCSFYLSATRHINTSYTNASGLFIKDLWRPITEALINLGLSIILVNQMGISGIIWGTIISHLVTVCWREPYLLHKYEFHISMKYYWTLYFKFVCLTLLECFIFDKMFGYLLSDIVRICIAGIVISLLCIFVLAITNIRNSEMKYLITKVKNKFK